MNKVINNTLHLAHVRGVSEACLKNTPLFGPEYRIFNLINNRLQFIIFRQLMSNLDEK